MRVVNPSPLIRDDLLEECIQVSILEQDPSLFAHEGMVQAVGPCLRHGLGDKWNLRKGEGKEARKEKMV